ncbi:MAG: CARDB domain-containing protein [Candidatus Peregrinibacteria bacterium]|nr:CARDB domain-containing protein [Candidatus Peregrinibacteria bacterium]
MEVRTKALVSVLLGGAVIGGVYLFSANNSALFKGQIFNDNTAKTENTVEVLPDLRAKLEVMPPASEQEDIKANVTIENAGEGGLSGEIPFKYTLYINDTEVFTNSDSYTEMAKGDSFSFTYPIPRAIYNYGKKGTVVIKIDTDNTIKESNENNNEVVVNYSL